MLPNRIQLSEYRMERAKEDIETARVNLENGFCVHQYLSQNQAKKEDSL